MTPQNDPKLAEDLSKKVAELAAKVESLDALITKAPIEGKGLYDMPRSAYAEYGNQIRHFSTVRSTLTVFLVTAGMTAFAGYLDKKFIFLLYAGVVFALAAIAVCLRFSYLTEKHVILYKDTWHLLNRKTSTAKLDNLDWEVEKGVWPRVCGDMMNWLLVGAAIVFLLYAGWAYTHRAVAAPIIVWPDDLQ